LSLTASLQLVGNLISDVCYMIIDPRIHFDRS
jgi:ABC-type microcin C transport system permease subunit YejB